MRKQVKTWHALLTDASRDRANGLVDAISTDLMRVADRWLTTGRDPSQGLRYAVDPSLAGGIAGVALYFWTVGNLEQVDAYRTVAWDLIECALGSVREVRQSGLATGLCGIGVVLHLIAGTDDSAGAALETLDVRVGELLSESLNSRVDSSFDFLSGWSGIGLYVATRAGSGIASDNPRRWLRLLNRAPATLNPGGLWTRRPVRAELQEWDLGDQPLLDLGISRGAPGILSVASLVSATTTQAEGVAIDRLVGEMLDYVVEGDSGPTLPMTVGGPDRRSQGARLAWCYGDLGVATSLLACTPSLNPAYRSRLCGVAESTVAIRAADPDADAALCHGSIGVAHMYSRLFQITQDETFAHAARYWYIQAMTASRAGTGIGGYLFCEAPGIWASLPGFLRGVAGVGLGLAAATHDVEPEWDTLILTRPAPDFAPSPASRPDRQ